MRACLPCAGAVLEPWDRSCAFSGRRFSVALGSFSFTLALTRPPPGRPLLQRNSACVLRLDARAGDGRGDSAQGCRTNAGLHQPGHRGCPVCVCPVPRGCLPPGRERCVLQPWGKRPHKRAVGPPGVRGGGVPWPQDTGAQLGRGLVCFRPHVYDSRKVTWKITWYASKVRPWIGHASHT